MAKRYGDGDPSTEWMIKRLTKKGEGLPKAEQVELRKAANQAVFDVRRALWLALVFDEADALADAFDARANDSDDYSNRQKIADLRHALASWIRGFAKEWRRKGSKAKRQIPMFGPTSWPTLSPDNERAMMRSWPHIDLVADRDGAVLMEVARSSSSPWVRRCLADMEDAIREGIEWNGKLVVSTARKFFAGDSLCLSMGDLLVVGEEGLARGLMDLNPNVASPSTHYVNWIKQRIRRSIERGTLIHIPSWIRDANAAIRRGSTAWQKADAARRKCRDKAKGASAYRKALARVPHRMIVRPIDPHEAHKALQALDDGATGEDALDLLTGSLGLSDATAVEVSEADDIAAAALSALSKTTKLKPDAIRKAVAQAPHYVASLDQRGRVDDDGDDRPAIELVANEEDGEGQAEAALLWRQLGEGFELLMATGPRGQEQAEVIRRVHGLEGPDESLTAIASSPLRSTGRTINRNTAKALLTAGIEWLTRWAGEEKVTVTSLSYVPRRGHRTPHGILCARSARRLRRKVRRQKEEPRVTHDAIKQAPKRPRKLPPRVHQLREAAAACA